MTTPNLIWRALDAKRFAILLRTGPLTRRLDRIAERLNR